MACSISLPLIIVTAKNLKNRPALHSMPEGRSRSYLVMGLLQIGATFHEMRQDFPEAAKYLISLAFFESATLSTVQLATTYLKSQMKVTDPIGFVIVAIIFTVLGAGSVPYLSGRVGVKR